MLRILHINIINITIIIIIIIIIIITVSILDIIHRLVRTSMETHYVSTTSPIG
jgi:hypothetical protein